MTHSHGKQVLEDLGPHTRELRALIPDVYAGFAATHKGALTAGALDTKTKELMAMAMGVGLKCDGCIASHARAAVKQGATLEEAADAIGVTILMGGGPASIYAPRAFAAFKEFFEAQ